MKSVLHQQLRCWRRTEKRKQIDEGSADPSKALCDARDVFVAESNPEARQPPVILDQLLVHRWRRHPQALGLGLVRNASEEFTQVALRLLSRDVRLAWRWPQRARVVGTEEKEDPAGLLGDDLADTNQPVRRRVAGDGVDLHRHAARGQELAQDHRPRLRIGRVAVAERNDPRAVFQREAPDHRGDLGLSCEIPRGLLGSLTHVRLLGRVKVGR